MPKTVSPHPCQGLALEFIVPGCPVPKARARATRGGKHWYTPAPTVAYERACGQAAMVARFVGPGMRWPLDKAARYRVECVFFMPDKRTRDGDNVLKSIQDGCERVLWLSDRQCIEGSYLTRYDKANPRAEVRAVVL